jgi:pyridoxal phosphate enzyme (YggS family)
VAAAARTSGRRAEDVSLIAVTKTHPAATVRAAFDLGLRHFGENKVQEADGKITELAELRAQGAAFHLIGHLQSNKAKRTVEIFDSVQSLDSVELARRLHRFAVQQDKVLPVMIEVDIAGEETKSGIPEKELLPLLEQVRALNALRLDGLMVVPPFSDDAEDTRPYFARLRELRDAALQRELLDGGALSMGMSHDYAVAIEEGATHVRVGTALFGSRPR